MYETLKVAPKRAGAANLQFIVALSPPAFCSMSSLCNGIADARDACEYPKVFLKSRKMNKILMIAVVVPALAMFGSNSTASAQSCGYGGYAYGAPAYSYAPSYQSAYFQPSYGYGRIGVGFEQSYYGGHGGHYGGYGGNYSGYGGHYSGHRGYSGGHVGHYGGHGGHH